jgi:tRNA pseudouridine55 synthase
VYEATVRLGQSTTTYDTEGEIVSTHQGPFPIRDEVESALEAFRGEILQRPPLFSAIKQGGEALYEKARRGEQVEVAPRPITIYTLKVTEWSPPDVGLYIHCSKGSYIRSLAHELGEQLGVGGYLSALRRTASGAFTLAHAHPLQAIADASPAEVESLLLPVGFGLDALPALEVDERGSQELRHGRPLPESEPLDSQPGESVPESTRARAVDARGTLVAIVRWRDDRGWQPEKVFL